MRDLRIAVRLYNNQLRERREERGFSVPSFAEIADVEYGAYLALETLRASPLTSGRGPRGPRPIEWRQIALRIAEFWDVDVAVLWPDEILAVERSSSEIRVDAEEFRALIENRQSLAAFDLLANKELNHQLVEALAVLNPREQRVIRGRFGIDGDTHAGHLGMTLDDLSEELGICRARVRQIEAKALRKLRHPSVAAVLKAYGGGPR